MHRRLFLAALALPLLGGCCIMRRRLPLEPPFRDDNGGVRPFGGRDDLPDFDNLEPPVPSREQSAEKVLATMKDNEEFIVVVGTTVCPACLRLKRQIMLAPPEIQRALGRFDVYWMNADNPLHRKAIAKMDVTLYPTTIRYRLKDGKPVELDRIVGAKLIPEYARILDFLTREHRDA